VDRGQIAAAKLSNTRKTAPIFTAFCYSQDCLVS